MKIYFFILFFLIMITPAYAWFGVSTYRYPIIVNNTTAQAVSINDTNGIAGSIVWALQNNESYVYSNSTGPVCPCTIANDTTQKFWENTTSRTGNTPTSVYDANAVAVWHFDENLGNWTNDSTVFNDVGKMISMNNATDWVAGNFGKALRFRNASSSYVNISFNSSMSLTANWTYAIWAKFDAFKSVNKVLFQHYASASAQRQIALYVNPATATLQIDVPWLRSVLTGTTVLKANQWYFLVFTRSANNWSIYINGTLDKSVIDSTAQEATTSIPLQIGGDTVGGGYMNGTLDEPMVFNRALAPIEISNMYNNGINNFIRLGAAETSSDTTPPTWNVNGTNNTNPLPLAQVLHYANWSDETGLSGYIFSWNATGATCAGGMTNDTWVAMTGVTNWSNATKQVPMACAGKVIDFLFYANDTSNNWNKTSDGLETENNTCFYSGTGDWWIDIADNCDETSTTNNINGDLYVFGNGTIGSLKLGITNFSTFFMLKNASGTIDFTKVPNLIKRK